MNIIAPAVAAPQQVATNIKYPLQANVLQTNVSQANIEHSVELKNALAQSTVGDVISLKLIALTSTNQLLTLLGNTPLTLNLGVATQAPQYIQDLINNLTNNHNTPTTIQMKVISNGHAPQLAFIDKKSANDLSPAVIAHNKLPSSPPLSAVISQVTLNAASTQRGLASLLSSLQHINENAVSLPQHMIKNSLQPLLDSLNARTIQSDKPINATQIRTLMQSSGLFYEANMQKAGLNAVKGDLKGLLIQVREILNQAQAQNNILHASHQSKEEITLQKTRVFDLKGSDKNETSLAPPLKNGALPYEPLVKSIVPNELPLSNLVERLIGQTQGAIERITLMQIASLPTTSLPTTTPQDVSEKSAPENNRLSYAHNTQAEQTPRSYMFEIPLRTPDGMASLGFKVQGPLKEEQKNTPMEKTRDIWQVKFGANLEPLGAIEAHIHIKTLNASLAKISVDLWADRIDVARSFQNARFALRDMLTKANFEVEELHVHVGKPIIPTDHSATHVVDMHL